MGDVYYRVDLNGALEGQVIKNTLYYKSEVELLPDVFPSMGAAAVAANVYQEIWSLGMKQTVSQNYTLNNIQVMPYNELFELIYSMPYTLSVIETGEITGDCMPPSTAVNIHFNLKAMSATAAMLAPKRGYVAIAGIGESRQASGLLVSTFWNDPLSGFGLLAQKLGENLQEITPPMVWVPVRMRPTSAGGATLVKWLGTAEVMDAYVQPVLSNRRSRKLLS